MVKVVSGWVLMLVGAFLLTAALLMWFVVPGMAQRTPKNVDTNTYLSGHAQKLNVHTGKVEDVPVTVWNNNAVDANRSTNDVVLFVSKTCANVDRNNPPKCLKKSDGRLISNEVDVFAADRYTGLAAPDQAKYGATAHTGLVNKFPFNTQRKSYPMWDSVLQKSVTASFAGTAEIDGLSTYRFIVRVPRTKAEIAQNTEGTYQMDKTIWVEPKTGAIINQTQHEVRKLPDGTTAINMHIAFTKATEASFVKDAKANLDQLDLLTSTGPIVACALGVLALIGGALLTFVFGRRSGAGTSDQELVTTS